MRGGSKESSPRAARTGGACSFCRIVEGQLDAAIVLEDELTLAFLDHAPLFPGHCLLIPKAHHPTLTDLPPEMLSPLLSNAQLLCGAVERVLGAEGTFVAMNNRVSQSVPHLHVHIVPRRRGDGLKGFFWPRLRYGSDEEIRALGRRIAEAVAGALESRN